MKFLHCDNSDKHIILHDCIAEKAYFQNGILGFEFEDGFWVSPEHPESDSSTFVKTDFSKAEFVLGRGSEFDITVYVFQRCIFGTTVRKEWKIDKLIDKINSGKCKIEFLYNYEDDGLRIIECYLRFDKRPYFAECQLKLFAPQINYYWNKMLEDRVW